MITKRIIPCLDVKDGRVVKGVNFAGLQDVSSPVELAEYYTRSGADELVFYDITASAEGRGLFPDILRRTASRVFIPLTVGGGINTLEDLDGKIIGVAQSSTTKDGFKAYAEEKGLDITPQFQEFDGYPALAQALATKQIDCFSVDGAILLGYVNDSNHLMDERFAQQDYGAAAARENTKLAELVDAKIKSMLSDGTMDTLKTRWGLE